MRLIAVFLLLLVQPVFADHHRGHAIGFTQGVDFHIDILESRITRLANVCELGPRDRLHVEVILRYSGFLHDNMRVTRDLLTQGRLDEARRKVSRPNQSGENSASTLVLGLMHRTRMLIGSCDAGDRLLAGSIQRISLAWEQVDFVIWHINDAIREEIYADPEFICAGPNNHCE